jgi:hypothetical protein
VLGVNRTPLLQSAAKVDNFIVLDAIHIVFGVEVS